MTDPEPPAVVWLVFNFGDAGYTDPGLYGQLIAIYPAEETAERFAATLRGQGRKIRVEPWEVPGGE